LTINVGFRRDDVPRLSPFALDEAGAKPSLGLFDGLMAEASFGEQRRDQIGREIGRDADSRYAVEPERMAI
jgi:hypothetical protein